MVLHLFIHSPKLIKLFFCITPCAKPMVCMRMESYKKTVLPDHLTTSNQLHIVPPARDGAGNSSGLNKICSVLPTFAKEGHQMALSMSGFPGLRPLITSNSRCLVSVFTATSWHKMVAGATAITSNIPGSRTGKG